MLRNTSEMEIAIIYQDNNIPVFTQNSITDMYNDRLIYHGSRYDAIDAVVFAGNTHATRLREKFQEKIPGVSVEKKSRKVTFTLDDEIGRTLYAVCTWSSEEYDRAFSKRARTLRMRFYEKEECFDEDVLIEKQVNWFQKYLQNSLV